MARKPGLARLPVASHRGSGACPVTPAPAGDETWPELRCRDAWRCWGTLLHLPGGERGACSWPACSPGRALCLVPSQMLPTVLPSDGPTPFPPLSEAIFEQRCVPQAVACTSQTPHPPFSWFPVGLGSSPGRGREFIPWLHGPQALRLALTLPGWSPSGSGRQHGPRPICELGVCGSLGHVHPKPVQKRWEGGCHSQAPCFSSPSSDLLENRLSRKKAQVCRVSDVCGLNTPTAAGFQVPVRAPV